MNFTKPMIDLAKEIRRRAPSEVKASVKMANPDLFDELVKIFHESNDVVLKALIKEICELAGEGWPEALQNQNNEPAPKQSVFAYRGQISMVEKITTREEKPTEQVKKRIYRGQVVHG